MTSALPLHTNINNTATDYCCEYTIQRVAASDDYGIYYLTELRQYLVDVHINKSILKELFIPALCARNGNRVIAKNSKCAGEFDEILTTFMSRAVKYNMCASRNDNLVHIDRPFFTNGTVYYSRHIYHGPSLAEYVAEHGPFTFAQVEQWLRPVCEAVALLHDNNIWHYAISPYNIQIVKEYRTKELAVLMDFGHAIQGLEPRKVLAYPTLTPYLPKEQYTYTRSSRGSTDVYALAATIYFCLTGHDPAYAEELNLDKVCDELLELNIEPERVNELLRALEPNYFKRHYSARKFTDALFATGKATPKTAPAANKPSTPSKSTRWIILAIVVIAVIAALAAIAWFTFGVGSSEECEPADTTGVEETVPAIADTIAANSAPAKPAYTESQQPEPNRGGGYTNSSPEKIPASDRPINQGSYNDRPSSPTSNKPGILPTIPPSRKPEQIQPANAPNDTVAC